MNVVLTDGRDKDFVELCRLLDENLNEIVGGEKQREQYIQYNTLDDIHDVVLVYIDKVSVGCASFKHFKDRIAEVKRVYVRKEYQGKGISNLLLHTLEERSRVKGYGKLVLETGAPLVAAMGLYIKRGYKRIDNYGQYKDMPESICMEKLL